jgi:CRISPR system Cascade subunit CasA
MAKTENRFNLMDEPWIPIAGMGLVSLGKLFRDKSLRALGGNPVQKIALTKLLLAICQAACTPDDDAAWEKLGATGLAKNALAYLDEHKDCFWLYGKKPFLQIPAIAAAAVQPYGAVLPDIATGNTTVLTQSQQERSLSDAEKALLVVQLMGFPLGGKKADNSVVLSPGYPGKSNAKGNPSTGKSGPSLGFLGYLHNFLAGQTLVETLWLNLLTVKDIKELKIFEGLGSIPWEKPPKGEDDKIARDMQHSLMGRLVPLSRFVLLAQEGVHYSEGIAHGNHLEHIIDPSVAANKSGKKVTVLWTDPSKRPWRSVSAMLGFFKDANDYFDCPYIHVGMSRIMKRRSTIQKKMPVVGLWSGGLRVSSNAGEQYVSGTDDYVESEYLFQSSALGSMYYADLQSEMNILDDLASVLGKTIWGYCNDLKLDGKSYAKKGTELFWGLCELKAQELFTLCGNFGEEGPETLRAYFLGCVWDVYETCCPRDTARQMEKWARHYPNLARFSLSKEEI